MPKHLKNTLICLSVWETEIGQEHFYTQQVVYHRDRLWADTANKQGEIKQSKHEWFLKAVSRGFPGGCQHRQRRHRSSPWSGKIPHPTATKPVGHSYCGAPEPPRLSPCAWSPCSARRSQSTGRPHTAPGEQPLPDTTGECPRGREDPAQEK